MGMKRIARASGVFVCIFMLMLAMTVSAFAVSNEIDVSKVSSGVVTVNYNDGTNAKMKVAITINGKTTYQDYTQGTVSSYSLVEGNGEYTISLYSNIAGNSYRRVDKQVVNVVLSSEFAPYQMCIRDRFNYSVCVRDIAVHRGGSGIYLLHKVDLCGGGHAQPRRAGDGQADLLSGQHRLDGAQRLAGPLPGLGIVPFVRAEQQFILIVQHHDLYRRRADVDTHS